MDCPFNPHSLYKIGQSFFSSSFYSAADPEALTFSIYPLTVGFLSIFSGLNVILNVFPLGKLPSSKAAQETLIELGVSSFNKSPLELIAFFLVMA